MKKTTDEVGQKVERVLFDLALPPEINVTPSFVVDLPRNKQAMVYQTTNTATDKERLVYDVYVVSKKTLTTQTRDPHYYNRSANSFANLPALKHWLYDVVSQLSVKKSTIKKVNVVDLQDADDDED